MTPEQAAAGLGEYNDVGTRLRRRADGGLYTPEEAASQVAGAQGAAQRAGNETARQAYVSRLAGGTSSPFAAAALQENASANAAVAGQVAANDITQQQAESRAAAEGQLVGLAGDRSAIDTRTMSQTEADTRSRYDTQANAQAPHTVEENQQNPTWNSSYVVRNGMVYRR